MAPNLWGSLLLTAVLAVPGAAWAQRPVDVGTMRARAESAQQAQGDSGKTAQSGTAAAKPAATKPAPNTSAKAGANVRAAAAKPGAVASTEMAAAKPTAPAVKPTAPKPAAPAAAGAATDSVKADSLNDPTEAQVLRENFSYSGGTRDPFASLIKSANAGPELSDLQLVAIYEDMHYSGNSVAVLREKGNNGKRHKLRAGDQLGRLRVAQVRSKDVVFTISDFGYERQETLSLRKQEDVTP
ncbi:MAG TPA: hypothetical protein VFS33_11650 [Gemmatimonadales bacterium]|nr:hypothetical protein [Gemmatimonadales bacterium]